MFIHINARLTSPYFNSIKIEIIKSYFNHSDHFDHFDLKFIIRTNFVIFLEQIR